MVKMFLSNGIGIINMDYLRLSTKIMANVFAPGYYQLGLHIYNNMYTNYFINSKLCDAALQKSVLSIIINLQ